jgi:hypothetical protein
MEVLCRVVFEDETVDHLDVESLSMRGAQREITGSLLKDGYTPAGRWEDEAVDVREDETIECVRRFKESKA